MKEKIFWPTFGAIGLMMCSSVFLIFNLKTKLTQVGSNEVMQQHIYQSTVYQIIGIIFGISIILYFILNHALNKVQIPIEELTEAMKTFKDTQYTHEIRDYETQEMINLADAFDAMCEDVSYDMRKLKHDKDRLQSLLASLEEGIIVIDRKGRIKQMNALAEKILNVGTDYELKSNVTHFLREEKFIGLVERVLDTEQAETIEMQIDEYYTYISMIPIGKDKEAYEFLIVIKDVTKMRALEAMRYQFVSNVSHELKTPLTSIQGFVETLQNGAIDNKEMANRFLSIIDVETKRLYRLIQDILLLSEIENGSIKEDQFLDIQKALSHIIEVLKTQAEQKGIALTLKGKTDTILSHMSEDHISQLFMNIINNAIRYTDKGEVTVTLAENETEVDVTITDTGIGMPKDALEHIFERFYRVDKGRSRKSGGTGLGLSIAKHIAQLYDIKIGVESELGKGTSFKLVFPKNEVVSLK